jgi:hypothetical protein
LEQGSFENTTGLLQSTLHELNYLVEEFVYDLNKSEGKKTLKSKRFELYNQFLVHSRMVMSLITLTQMKNS